MTAVWGWLQVRCEAELASGSTGVAISGDIAARSTAKGLVFDVDSDGNAQRFTLCTSGEGLHINVWTGSTRMWHGYRYLGYDTESDCTPAEYNE